MGKNKAMPMSTWSTFAGVAVHGNHAGRTRPPPRESYGATSPPVWSIALTAGRQRRNFDTPRPGSVGAV